MLAVAHEARLAQRTNPSDPNSPTKRQGYEALAARGRASSQAALQAPDVPEEFDYLRQWSGQLFGRSGAGMSGVAPLSPSEIESWSRITGNAVTPAEVEALLFLDSVRRDPTIVDRQDVDVDEAPAPKLSAAQRWPTKKVVQ